MNGGCTIVSPNYLPFARTLAKSYLNQHPEETFWVLIVANILDKSRFRDEPFQPIFLDELGLPSMSALAMKYNILELNTNVKPTFLKFLLSHHSLERLVYLDPDIYVYRKLGEIDELLVQSDVILTPHITSPMNTTLNPWEKNFLQSGTYNLGFIALRKGRNSGAFLDWWEQRCLSYGFSELQSGLFVDQKWVTLAPAVCDGVNICKHPGYNMAYWNLHERTLSYSDGVYHVNGANELAFYHFSGIEIDDAHSLSRYTDSYSLRSRDDLRILFEDYKRDVRRNRNPVNDSVSYGFDHFSDGTGITTLARRIFSAHQHAFSTNPFEMNGPFYNFAIRECLVRKGSTAPSVTWRQFDPRDKRVLTVNRLLRLTLRVLGPHRYEALMKYLAHIAILRNQSVFLRPGH